MRANYGVYKADHFRLCAELLVLSGLCGSHQEFWKSWAGLSEPLPKGLDRHVHLSSHNIASIKGSIGAQAIIIDDCIDHVATKSEQDQLYRDFETLHVASRRSCPGTWCN